MSIFGDANMFISFRITTYFYPKNLLKSLSSSTSGTVISCVSEILVLFHERWKVAMENTISALNRIVPCQEIFGIIVAYLLQRPIFSFLRFTACHDGHSDLEVGIFIIASAQDKITFQLSDTAYADGISFRSGVQIHRVFHGRSVIDPLVCIEGIIEAKVGQIEFFFAGNGFPGFQIKSVTGIEDLRVNQYIDIPVKRFPFD